MAKPSDKDEARKQSEDQARDRRQKAVELLYHRLMKCLEAVTRKMEDRILNDPGYQPSPSDLQSILKAVGECEILIASGERMTGMLADAKQELTRLESTFLSFMTKGI